MNIPTSFRIFLASLLATISVFGAPQPTFFTVLRNFTGNPDGGRPVLPMVLGSDNVLYGSTFLGGTNNEGIVFRINRDGTGYSAVHHFSPDDQVVLTPTAAPGAYLVLGRDGVLYGTTFGGSVYANGVAFSLNTDGSGYTVLHAFTTLEGRPLTLIQGVDGNLYGAGVSSVFTLGTNGGNFSVLHSFNSATDGGQAYGKLLQASDGFLYGAAKSGGTNGGFGTVFKITTNGTAFSVLHTFGATDDGANPYAGLIEGSDGALYGTAHKGGSNTFGTVFKLNRDGTGYRTLHYFQSNGVDGQNPFAGLVLGLNNFLYGTTINGGTNSVGILYRIGQDGNGYEILRNFTPTAEGSTPYGTLVQGPASDGSGVMYGTTEADGAAGYGNIFALIVNPPISITPAISQSGGHPVVIWPAWAINYQLQSTTNLAGTWTTTTNYVPVTGAQLTNDEPGSYYRLVWPQ